MMKEMSEEAANKVFDKLENHTFSSLDNLLNKWVSLLLLLNSVIHINYSRSNDQSKMTQYLNDIED